LHDKKKQELFDHGRTTSTGKEFGHRHQLSNQGLHEKKPKENNCEEEGFGYQQPRKVSPKKRINSSCEIY